MKKGKNKVEEEDTWEDIPRESPVKELERRINNEKNRLLTQFKNVEQKKRLTVQGLIERAAFMRVTLEDLEKDINQNGVVELFSQSENQDPYTRKRPAADMYNTLNANYQKIIKLLTDLLPKDIEKPTDDGFDDFVNERNDV